MPPRANPSIDLMLSQARQKLIELKELQFFGGDALNLKRYSQNISVAGDGLKHCWRLRITPSDPNTMMPFSVITKPNSADYLQVVNASVEAVHRDDNIFEYLIMSQNFDSVARGFKLRVEYSGVAAFDLVQIG